ncbi:hypothetical protein L211DRAFT_781050, partial [Terfezia boudieri ATCC MYA-4762]
MDVLGTAASVIAVVQLSGQILTLCQKYYDDVKEAKTDMENLRNEITSIQAVLQRAQELAEGTDKLATSKALIRCLKAELVELVKMLDPGKRKKAMRTIGLRALKWPFTKADIEKTLRSLERHKTTLITALDTDQITNISKLPYADGAAYYDRLWEHEDQCLPDTRVELLQQIMAWSGDAKGAYIFWLNGMAGTGKSTISRTVARQLAEEKKLAASFFFSRGRGDIGHAGKFFTTIATQLAHSLPALSPSLSKAIDEHLNISQRGLSEQWKHLILGPLSGLKDTPTRAQSASMVIVIDALDECENEDDIKLILALLAQAQNLNSIRLRVFVTSRPETPILCGFRRMPGETHQDFVLHDIPPTIVSHDISVFFQLKLAQVKADCGLHLGTPWPDEETIELLVQRASGLFIYAATTYRFIRQTRYHPQEQLALILMESKSTSAQSPTKELDAIYTQILRHSVLGATDTDEHEELLRRFKECVGSVVVMSDMIPKKNLARLLSLPKWKVELTLMSLGSVLYSPLIENQPIRILHPSFRDFLLNQQRCLDTRFWIDDKERHINLFRDCLELMSTYLRQDICGLREPGILVSEISVDIIQDAIEADIQYACRYWVYHFQQGNSAREDNDRILQFLRQHLLHWLEVLCLLGQVSEGVLMIATLEKMPEQKLNLSQDLLALAYDARRFILSNRLMIEVAPLQVYYSALVFSPERSL